MSLPVPDLDDRRFQDLVDEAKRMIPGLVPEWTNHNVADPGVALIELFAWMSEQVIFRLNQVPEKLYVEFLNLLGTGPFPAASARVPLTFWLAGVPEEPVTVPAGTEAMTEQGVTFATLDDLRIIQPELIGALTSIGEGTYVDVLPELRYDRDSVACFASVPVAVGDAFNLGFEESMASQLLELHIKTAGRGIGVDPEDVPIVWEAWSGEHWLPADVIDDTTGGLNRSGTVRVVIPALHEPMVLAGQRSHWLRVRLVEPRADQPTFRTSPAVSDVRVVSRGGTVMAEHAVTVTDEIVGTSEGTPGQRFALNHRPVLPREPGEQVTVRLGGLEEAWIEVADFAESGPTDRHVVFDESQGLIEFGPVIRYPDGSSIQHGAIPAFGADVIMSRYRTGGGAVGNVGSDTLTMLRTSVAYVDRVTNLVPARGGVDPESVDEVKLRGPRSLRTGQRAVTRSDFEQLALEASPQVARAKCIPPAETGKPIRLLVVPASDSDPSSFELDDFALTPELFATVASHLDARRTIGSQVRVTAPYYQGVSVVARVRAIPGRSPVAVKERVAAMIARYLSPLEGGLSGTGWAFDEDLKTANLSTLIEDVPGVAAVDELVLFEFDLRNLERIGDPVDTIELEPASLFLSGRTQVVVR